MPTARYAGQRIWSVLSDIEKLVRGPLEDLQGCKIMLPVSRHLLVQLARAVHGTCLLCGGRPRVLDGFLVPCPECRG